MNAITNTLTIFLIGALSLLPSDTKGQAAPETNRDKREMKINITIDGNTAVAVLEDNPVAREFVSLLPLTADFEDFASSEKISYLPRKLNIKNSDANYEAEVWDITYYIPWGNLAIFYKGYAPSKDLAKIGRIVSGNQFLTQERSFKARIERAED